MLPYTEEDLSSIFLAELPLSYAKKKVLISRIPLKKLLSLKRQSILSSICEKDTATFLIQEREKFDTKRKTDQYGKHEVRVIRLLDKAYPKLLKEIPDPPFCLFIKGDIPFQERCISVVGSRKMTPYGKEMTQRLVCDLVSFDVCIISGLALGIDGVAHTETLNQEGKTIAVIASGLDHISPTTHLTLAQEIVRHGGCIMTERPLGVQPTPESFPVRNRIIAGLSQGVVVVEGERKSGTQITAGWAASYGRDVFAIPCPVTSPLSEAPHLLIKDGAKLIENGIDVAEEFGWERTHTFHKDSTLLSILAERNGIQFNEIAKATGLPEDVLAQKLTLFELEGIISRKGNLFIATKKRKE